MDKNSEKEEKINKIKVTSLDIIVTISGDKPYYEIKYKEVGENFYHIGDSSYDLGIVLDYKKKYFELIVCENDEDNPWIVCKDGQMPEDFNYKGNKILNVLVTTATGKVTKVQRIQDYGDKHIWRWCRIFGECKAWMPLPQHYNGNKKHE